MSKLVIVESPAKAKTIKKYLGPDYEVMASMGHIRDLPKSKMGVDIEHGFTPQYVEMEDKKDLIKSLQNAAAKSDMVYLATDPDREGEAISWHLAQLLALNTNECNRVAFNEITKTGVKNGMAHPHKIDLNLVDAQQARRVLDRIVGYKLSPFLWKKVRRGLSAGRVQSVALKLIVEREKEINAFQPEEYWSIDALFTHLSGRSFAAKFHGPEKGKKLDIHNKEEADALLAKLKGAAYSVKSVKKGVRNKQPAPPFTTSTLQQEASRKLGFTGQRTMRAAQQLYEGVEIPGMGTTGLITYMRTDSLRISEEARAAGNAYITQRYGQNYLPEKPRYYRTKSGAQDAHEAIRPTIASLTPDQVRDSLTLDQYKLYRLIWERFIASLMAACVQDTISAGIIAETAEGEDNYLFKASGYTVRFDGYTVLYEEGKDEEDEETGGALPPLAEKDPLTVKSMTGNQHFTQPPARYTEPTLIKALDEYGIGRPSTYAPIISNILNREYIERDKKSLKPTPLGETVTGLLMDHFASFVDVGFTAEMEKELDTIEEGKLNWVKVIEQFYDKFEKTLDEAEKAMEGVRLKVPDIETDITCELCGRKMVIKTGRFGKFLACPGYPECKNTKPIVKETPGLCPVCGGKILQKKSKNGHKYYGCEHNPTCGFMTWDDPTAEKCPECGKTLFKRRGGLLVCLDEACGYQTKVERKSRKNAPAELNDDLPETAAKKTSTAKTAAKKTAAKSTSKKGTASKSTAKKTTKAASGKTGTAKSTAKKTAEKE
ncbi:MAG TPA: type I DNA topoisomerase [Firmicutes bacterium]|nr:type I DNA topoisomerase [Bacillota bacterium]